MRTTNLGQLIVSAQGLGCMGMSEWYGPTDWDESIATIHRAADLGIDPHQTIVIAVLAANSSAEMPKNVR